MLEKLIQLLVLADDEILGDIQSGRLQSTHLNWSIFVIVDYSTAVVSKRIMISAGLRNECSEWNNARVISLTYQHCIVRYFTV